MKKDMVKGEEMKIIQSDYIHKNDIPTDICDDCSNSFDLNQSDQVFVIQTEDDELFAFCNDYNCYHNYNT
tara:strand:- start:780 stop:989 length:210 start_codon:yes stop_codon:yes gene_type:complete